MRNSKTLTFSRWLGALIAVRTKMSIVLHKVNRVVNVSGHDRNHVCP